MEPIADLDTLKQRFLILEGRTKEFCKKDSGYQFEEQDPEVLEVWRKEENFYTFRVKCGDFFTIDFDISFDKNEGHTLYPNFFYTFDIWSEDKKYGKCLNLISIITSPKLKNERGVTESWLYSNPEFTTLTTEVETRYFEGPMDLERDISTFSDLQHTGSLKRVMEITKFITKQINELGISEFFSLCASIYKSKDDNGEVIELKEE